MQASTKQESKGLRPDSAVLVLFGASGDLAKRKLIPGLYHLYRAGLMPEKFRIIGSAPAGIAMDADGFVEMARTSVATFGRREGAGSDFEEFAKSLSYCSASTPDFSGLASAVQDAREETGAKAAVFYLAVPPPAFVPVITALGASGLAKGSRLIIEKPFGYDLKSAKELNRAIHGAFSEDEVYRIDHFLGKEAVQNILALRFANGIFEPAWNRSFLEYVQLDVPETLTIEGRGAFYEETGAYRDMIVTHLLQVLGFLAMEPPGRLDARSLNAAKNHVFAALRPLTKEDVVFGQYEGYLQEPGVAAGSRTETLVAARVWIDNDRWSGVPFFLRTGKAMGAEKSVATLGFRVPDLGRFEGAKVPDRGGACNQLALDLGDPGSIEVSFLAKTPGVTMDVAAAELTFSYAESFNMRYELAAYERLLHDALLGDRTLFNAAEGIERLWEASAPLLEDPPRPITYAKGSFGPGEVNDLIDPYAWKLG